MSNNNETSLIMVYKCIIETKQWFGRNGITWCLLGQSNYPMSAKNCKLMLFIRIFAFHWNILKLVQIMISWQSESLFSFFVFVCFFSNIFVVYVLHFIILSLVSLSLVLVYEGDDFEPNRTLMLWFENSFVPLLFSSSCPVHRSATEYNS